ncbi:MAG TPA: (d)CMP kinase [Oligoflexia bacterium]|nr:(d)CMP kinase [Oligoflexia bacterium]
MIVTIDGPAGSGKSTVARKLANKLGFIHLNSGALFRAVGLKAQAEGVPLEDDCAVADIASRMRFEFKLTQHGGERRTVLFVDGEDIGARLSSDEAGYAASRIGVLPRLREVLLNVQRKVAQGCSVVLEGRDAGTVVFPWAEAKFYLDAAAEVRAKRRFDELVSYGADSISVESVLRDMTARDEREMTREVAPLRPAADAMIVDTTDLSIEQVVEKLRAAVEEKQ